jgi:hypothetical protein
VETDATDDQRALLEVSTRFMEDVCPLRAVRDGAWRDAAFAAAYRRQAAELDGSRCSCRRPWAAAACPAAVCSTPP